MKFSGFFTRFKYKKNQKFFFTMTTQDMHFFKAVKNTAKSLTNSNLIIPSVIKTHGGLTSKDSVYLIRGQNMIFKKQASASPLQIRFFQINFVRTGSYSPHKLNAMISRRVKCTIRTSV